MLSENLTCANAQMLIARAPAMTGPQHRPGGGNAMSADSQLDCTGLQCPLPVIKTAQTMKTLEMGQVLELLATDPGVEPDMKAWAGRTGNELIAIEEQDGVFHVLLRRAR